ncbi:YDG/SRA domain-containing protein [Streptomyces humicola]|uniref:YDG/SRA domain-containing protein n=1 Tax=Streptomyces humicola TaxID=2953240 RepID=UPI00355642D3
MADLDDFDGFGQPPDVHVGQEFKNRRALYEAKVHRQTQGGICGTAAKGAESIVVSGGYEDDADFGSEIIYTGQGARSDSGKQIDHQYLKLGNAALVTSISSGRPVRVIRGRGGDPAYSPKQGLRYDGLYRVEEFWSTIGKSGFRVYLFRLRELTELKSDVNAATVISKTAPSGNPSPRRNQVTTQRIVRSTKVADHVKRLHDYTCQVCGIRLSTPTGAYAEAAHIQGLGSPHNGFWAAST